MGFGNEMNKNSSIPFNSSRFCPLICPVSKWNGKPYIEPIYLVKPNPKRYAETKYLIYVYTSLFNFQQRSKVRDLYKKTLDGKKVLPIL